MEDRTDHVNDRCCGIGVVAHRMSHLPWIRVETVNTSRFAFTVMIGFQLCVDSIVQFQFGSHHVGHLHTSTPLTLYDCRKRRISLPINRFGSKRSKVLFYQETLY